MPASPQVTIGCLVLLVCSLLLPAKAFFSLPKSCGVNSSIIHKRAPMTVDATSSGGGGGADKKGVMFICLGNICRSPAAEAVFRHVAKKNGVGR